MKLAVAVIALVLSVLIFVLMCGCAAMPAPQPEATTVVSSTVEPVITQPTPIELLAAHSWVDMYDSNFVLTFDAKSGTLTEVNDIAGSRASMDIIATDSELRVISDTGDVSATLPYTLENDKLSIDFGGTLGVLVYTSAK
ncbi:MAG: hypothetical protein RR232_04830 [Clostridia bacterium]